MANDDYQEEQTELLRALVGLMLDANYESTKEKVHHLANYDFTYEQIGDVVNKNKSTVSRHLSED